MMAGDDGNASDPPPLPIPPETSNESHSMSATTSTSTKMPTTGRGGEMISMMGSIPLSELPLRPSTIQLFTQRGFETTSDIDDARKFGLSNLAAELHCDDLTEVAGLVRELDGCIDNARFGSFLLGGSVLPPMSTSTSTNVQNHIDDGEPGWYYKYNNHTDHHQSITTGMAAMYPSPTNVMTASELMQNPSSSKHGGGGKLSGHIVTFSQKVDELLGGGIRLGEVTEIAGLPGCGKTQLAMQLSVMARLPKSLGGVQGRTLYIDTEGSFAPERAWDMAEALHIHVQNGQERRRKRAKRHNNNHQHPDVAQIDAKERDAQAFTVEEILRSIQVFRVHDETALTSTLYSLPQYMEQSKYDHDEDGLDGDGDVDNDLLVSSIFSDPQPVKLIVIDSIAFQFRAVAPTDPSYYVQRSKTLANIASFLGDLASKYNVAVVAINQMTTKVGTSSSSSSSNNNNSNNGDNNTALVPALGEAWAHATATRLLLSNSDNTNDELLLADECDLQPLRQQQQHNQQLRTCELVKSSHRPSGYANFVILPEGIRGLEYVRGSTSRSSNNVAHPDAAPPPRQRDTNIPDDGRPMSHINNEGSSGSHHTMRKRPLPDD